MTGAKSQLDQRAGIGSHFGLPAMVGLKTGHRLLSTRVPCATGRTIQIVFPNQRLLNLGGAITLDSLLSVVLPCARAGPMVAGTFCRVMNGGMTNRSRL